MPMMLSPDTLLFSTSRKRPFTHSPYGHQTRIATQCHHEIHPSNPPHTPRCPKCTISLARGKSDVTLKELAAEGGLQLLQAPCEGGCRQVGVARRCLQAAVVHDGNEEGQVVKHDSIFGI